MMNTPKNRGRLLRYALVLPLIAAGTLIVNPSLSAGLSSEPEVAGQIAAEPDEMPSFKGGQEGLFKFLQENIKYPEMVKEGEIEGKVYVTFVVDENGKVRDAEVAKGVADELDAEALRVVNAMPDWNPGLKDGKAVAVKMTLPILFKL